MTSFFVILDEKWEGGWGGGERFHPFDFMGY